METCVIGTLSHAPLRHTLALLSNITLGQKCFEQFKHHSLQQPVVNCGWKVLWDLNQQSVLFQPIFFFFWECFLYFKGMFPFCCCRSKKKSFLRQIFSLFLKRGLFRLCFNQSRIMTLTVVFDSLFLNGKIIFLLIELNRRQMTGQRMPGFPYKSFWCIFFSTKMLLVSILFHSDSYNDTNGWVG